MKEREESEEPSTHKEGGGRAEEGEGERERKRGGVRGMGNVHRDKDRSHQR